METVESLLQKYYEEFRGLPSNNPIVRNDQENDAFEVVVLRILYGKRLGFEFTKKNVGEIAKYIPAPPDAGIDIFIPDENGDDVHFDVIQVKNKPLNQSEIQQAFSYMEKTIKTYAMGKYDKIESESCKAILSESALDPTNYDNCTYYVIHTGDFEGEFKEDRSEIVINSNHLELLLNNVENKVESAPISLKNAKAVLNFGDENSNQHAIICSMNCHDLAKLENKYSSSELGRNILFGQNLRESLIKKNNSFKGMVETITNNPENFWYFNNGITIVADNIVKNTKKGRGGSEIILKNFSIVNGAQTTSALGKMLRDAKLTHNIAMEDALKKADVLTRILIVTSEETQQAIAIKNNTQTPITSRDMVANNLEQKELYRWLLDDEYAKIYMEIKRGARLPDAFNKKIAHRKTTNEALAQLAFAGFLLNPFIAKDKKSSLFAQDFTQENITVNQYYHEIFNHKGDDSNNYGILFKKTKPEIDELLFVQQLYKDCKKYMKNHNEQIKVDLEHKIDENNRETIQNRIYTLSKQSEAINLSMLYFVTAYYLFATTLDDNIKNKTYDYEKYYSNKDKNYKDELVKAASNIFLTKTTAKILVDLSKKENNKELANLIRLQKCEAEFKDELVNKFNEEFDLVESYNKFMNDFKTIEITK